MTALGLLLLASLSLLFVPVRYRIQGKAKEEFCACIQISWFWRIVHFQASYAQGKLQQRIRIFGIPIRLGKNKNSSKPKKRTKKKSKSKAEKTGYGQEGKARPPKTQDLLRAEKQTDLQQPQTRAAIEERQAQAGTEGHQAQAGTEERQAQADTEKSRQAQMDIRKPPQESVLPSLEPVFESAAGRGGAKKKSKKAPFFEKIYRLPRMISLKWETIKEGFQKVKEAGKELRQKAESVKGVFRSVWEACGKEENRAAFLAIFREMKYLAAHMRPRKILADISFGTPDPATTGQILGGISILPFLYRYRIQLFPDFSAERFYIKGEFDLRGHARGCHIALSGFRLLKDDHIRSLLQRYRNS